MSDIVKCSYCDMPVLWADYGDHVGQYHRDRFIGKLDIPECRALEVIGDHVEELEGELANTSDDARMENGRLDSRIRELEYDLDIAINTIKELKANIERLEWEKE